MFSQEDNLSGPADKLIFFTPGPGSGQGKHCGAIRRSNNQQAITRWQAGVNRQAEPKQIQEVTQAAILVANKNSHSAETEVRILPVRMKAAPVARKGWRNCPHRLDYSAETLLAGTPLIGRHDKRAESGRQLSILGQG